MSNIKYIEYDHARPEHIVRFYIKDCDYLSNECLYKLFDKILADFGYLHSRTEYDDRYYFTKLYPIPNVWSDASFDERESITRKMKSVSFEFYRSDSPEYLVDNIKYSDVSDILKYVENYIITFSNQVISYTFEVHA